MISGCGLGSVQPKREVVSQGMIHTLDVRYTLAPLNLAITPHLTLQAQSSLLFARCYGFIRAHVNLEYR